MKVKGTLISVEDALDIVLRETCEFGIEEIDFKESLGRVLKEEVKADHEMPPFDRVSMDGIALKTSVSESLSISLSPSASLSPSSSESLSLSLSPSVSESLSLSLSPSLSPSVSESLSRA